MAWYIVYSSYMSPCYKRLSMKGYTALRHIDASSRSLEVSGGGMCSCGRNHVDPCRTLRCPSEAKRTTSGCVAGLHRTRNSAAGSARAHSSGLRRSCTRPTLRLLQPDCRHATAEQCEEVHCRSAAKSHFEMIG